MSTAVESKPCSCWTLPPALHGGHCCFEAGTLEDYEPEKPIPCGHEAPGTIRCAVTGQRWKPSDRPRWCGPCGGYVGDDCPHVCRCGNRIDADMEFADDCPGPHCDDCLIDCRPCRVALADAAASEPYDD